MKKIFVLIIFLLISLGFFISDYYNNSPKVYLSDDAPKPIGPYSQAIEKNNTLFVAGQVAVNPKNGAHDTLNFETETKRVLNNLNAILQHAGYDWEDVCKVTVYLTDLKKFPEFNKIYGQFVKAPYPARETVEVKALPKGFHVEISLIAMQ